MRDARVVLKFVTYASIGAVGTLAQYVVLVATVASGRAGPVAGSVSGAVVGAFVNYCLNRRLTFRSAGSHLKTLPKFAATACLGVLVNGVVMKVLTDDNRVNYMIAQVLATGLVLALTFLINSVWTFRQQRPNGSALLAAQAARPQPVQTAVDRK
jgi:putative flippase GtrA